jgi:hypothetical protein
MPRPKVSADLLEDRRWHALALLDRGYSLRQVGRQVGCAAVSVMRWRDARLRGSAIDDEHRFGGFSSLQTSLAEFDKSEP